MIQIHRTPMILEKIYPSLTWRRDSNDELFLTFDDGPHPEITSWVLEELDKYQAKATFFCVGENLNSQSKIVNRMVEKGHLLANHTQNHLKGWKVNNNDYVENVLECEAEIRKIQEQKRQLFRPPYGRIKKSQIEKLKSQYEIIMWSHLSWDFDNNLNASVAIKNLKKARPGSIIVFHDSEKAFKNLKKILPEILPYWTSLHYRLNRL